MSAEVFLWSKETKIILQIAEMIFQTRSSNQNFPLPFVSAPALPYTASR